MVGWYTQTTIGVFLLKITILSFGGVFLGKPTILGNTHVFNFN